MLDFCSFVTPLQTECEPSIALQHAARYITSMNSCSPHSKPSLTARLIALLSLGLLLRTART